MLATVYRHHHGASLAVSDRLLAGKVSVTELHDRRSSLSESVGSAHPAIVTWGEFVRAPVSIPSFFVVITTFSETVWTQLTVLILDYLVPWVSHSGRRQGTKDDQRDVFEVENGSATFANTRDWVGS